MTKLFSCNDSSTSFWSLSSTAVGTINIKSVSITSNKMLGALGTVWSSLIFVLREARICGVHYIFGVEYKQTHEKNLSVYLLGLFFRSCHVIAWFSCYYRASYMRYASFNTKVYLIFSSLAIFLAVRLSCQWHMYQVVPRSEVHSTFPLINPRRMWKFDIFKKFLHQLYVKLLLGEMGG